MTWAAAILAAIVFFALARTFGAGRLAATALTHLREAQAALRDPQLDDGAKEARARQLAGQLMQIAAKIVAATTVALALPAAGLFGLSACGLLDGTALLELVGSWRFLLTGLLLALGLTKLRLHADQKRP